MLPNLTAGANTAACCAAVLVAAVSLSDAPPTSVPFISDLTISGPLTAEPPTIAVLSAVNPLPGVEAQAAVSPLAVIASVSVPPDLPLPAASTCGSETMSGTIFRLRGSPKTVGGRCLCWWQFLFTFLRGSVIQFVVTGAIW